MSSQPKTLVEAREELRAALLAAFEPICLPILRWLDQQLRRWPRLYAYLSR
jgi:hypothetical protein